MKPQVIATLLCLVALLGLGAQGVVPAASPVDQPVPAVAAPAPVAKEAAPVTAAPSAPVNTAEATPARPPGRSFLGSIVNRDTLERGAYVLLALVFGFLLVRLFLAAAKHVARRQLPARGVDIVEKTVKYGGAALVVINASRIAGIDLSAVLGAAGVAGIALGFAAQTSVSNIISGIFLFSEKTFTPGDVINLGDVTGTVESVDMLSVKLRTADNRLVRVPNETMIKSNIVNLTHWPTRRMDLSFVVPYGADVAEIERLLLDAARETPAALASPPPFFMPDRLSPDGIAIIFGVWFNQEDFVEVKRRLVPHIADRLARIGLKPAAQTIRLDETGVRAG